MRILSIPGGGAAGYGVTSFLATLEAETGGRITDFFDLLTGVSTGAIIAAGLASGMSAREVHSFYERYLPTIFKRQGFLSGWFRSAKYSNKALRQVLETNFKGRWCDLRKDVLVPAAVVEPVYHPRHWKSWRDDDTDSIVDVLMATSAAPTFFDPHVIGPDVFVDGAIVDVDSTMHAVVEATRMGSKLEDLRVLTVAAFGQQAGIKGAAKVKSMLQWAPRLPHAFLENGNETQQYQAKRLLGTNWVDVTIDSQSGMDDVSPKNLDDLVRRGAGAARLPSTRFALAEHFGMNLNLDETRD